MIALSCRRRKEEDTRTGSSSFALSRILSQKGFCIHLDCFLCFQNPMVRCHLFAQVADSVHGHARLPISRWRMIAPTFTAIAPCACPVPNDAARPGILSWWRVNGTYDFGRIIKDPAIPVDYINHGTKGCFKLFQPFLQEGEAAKSDTCTISSKRHL